MITKLKWGNKRNMPWKLRHISDILLASENIMESNSWLHRCTPSWNRWFLRINIVPAAQEFYANLLCAHLLLATIVSITFDFVCPPPSLRIWNTDGLRVSPPSCCIATSPAAVRPCHENFYYECLLESGCSYSLLLYIEG